MGKIKGHASWEDVRTGRVSTSDKHGNDRADDLATMGAAMHGVSQEDRTNFRFRVQNAIDLQKMMVEILAARKVYHEN